MQKTLGLTRVGSGRAVPSAPRSSIRSANGLQMSGLNYDGKIAGLYDLEETLGRGHFAVVKLARHVFTGEKVAVKVIDKTKLDEVSRAHLFQEVRCMKLVQHPNVVRLYEVIDTQTKLYLILELGDGGDLYDYIMRHENGLDQECARHYFRQVVHAISYCHQLHVVHRDLKPENVVFFEKLGMVKLTDFGFSNKYNPGQKLETSCGSLAYSAPEILLGDSYDAPAVDIWSLGVILYMLVCGHPPFQEANDSETLTMIMDVKYTVPPHVSEGCRRLIGRMLQRDPAKRANLEEIANDPWLQEGAMMAQPATYLPLVSREHLSEEDHALILQKMVNGGIATKEEILDALDKDEYNNITATYFLLAERKLRAQRQEQAMMVSRGQTPALLSSVSQPSPEEREEDLKEEALELGETRVPSKAPVTWSLTYRAAAEPLQGAAPGALGGRPRKYSAVDEEDESASVGGGGAGSGSESSRRSQRSSSNSLASQRTSNTSLASQRASNNSLAGSLRARGLLNSSAPGGGASTPAMAIPPPSTGRSADLRLEFIAEVTPGSCSPKQKVLPPEHPAAMEAPAPFPTTSNIGLGLRSPRVSPLTSPVTGHRFPQQTLTGSGRTTPASISPTSPSTPSSPGSSPTVANKGGRAALPSPSRVLHAVRSSPQLILNEIFEEAESDSEIGSSGAKSPGLRFRNSQVAQRTHQPGNRAVSAGPSASSASGNLVHRRYEQRRALAKTRTASCSSSDASDNDDSEGRKKRAEKLHKTRLPPTARRDSHDDSSDPGGDGPTGGPDGDGAGLSGGCGSSEAQEDPSNSDSHNSNGANEEEKNGRSGSSGGRNHMQPDPLVGRLQMPDGQQHRSRFRPHHPHLKGRRFTNACSFSLLSPGLGSETHLRASQSLSCLTEMCNEAPSDSPRIVVDSLELPGGSCSPGPGSRPVPTRSCSNLEKIEEASASGLDSSQELDFRLLLPVLPPGQPGVELEPLEAGEVDPMDVTLPLSEVDGMNASCSCLGAGSDQQQQPSTSPKKQKRLKQFFTRGDGAHASFKKSDKRPKSRKNRVKNSPAAQDCREEGPSGSSCEACGDASGESSSPGRTMSYLRSRLYKAKSLGSLVKERILMEASHCQYELWKRFGRTPPKNGDVNMNGPTALMTSPAAKSPPPGGELCCSVSAATVFDSTC